MSAREVWVIEDVVTGAPVWMYQREIDAIKYNALYRQPLYRIVRYVPAPKPSKKGKKAK